MDNGVPSSKQASSYELHIVFSPDIHAARRWQLPFNDVLTIGRDQGQATLFIQDGLISRQHATIHWDNDSQAYLLVDRGSRNGVHVNGMRISATHLQAGDVIRLGGTLLVLVHEASNVAFDTDLPSKYAIATPILIIGEQGVGKEHLAGAIHEQSERSGRFIAVDCATFINNDLIGEFLGQASSLSSAFDLTKELFAAAREGTLLLNHIDEMPRSLQSVVARLLDSDFNGLANQTQGRSQGVHLLATSAVPLEPLISSGRFRLGLFACISSTTIRLVPLRERRHQILRILSEIAEEKGHCLPLHVDAAEAIILGDWPTNIHGLQRIVANAARLGHSTEQITLSVLRNIEPNLVARLKTNRNTPIRPSMEVPSARISLRNRNALESALCRHAGNIAGVARDLGVTRAQIYRWIRKLDIDIESARGGE
jgi:DNA-binding NtrC family response regulator